MLPVLIRHHDLPRRPLLPCNQAPTDTAPSFSIEALIPPRHHRILIDRQPRIHGNLLQQPRVLRQQILDALSSKQVTAVLHRPDHSCRLSAHSPLPQSASGTPTACSASRTPPGIAASDSSSAPD